MANIRSYPNYSISSRSEKRFFELASQLSAEWTVWMNRQLNFITSQGEVNREIDGILYHPEIGILLVECKDGLLSIERPVSEGAEPAWIQSGNKLPRSPVDQVRTMHSILHDHFKQMFKTPLRVQWAVFFPDMEDAGNIIGSVSKPHLFLKGDSLKVSAFDRKVRKALTTAEQSFGGKPYPHKPLDPDDEQGLFNFLGSYEEISLSELWAMNESMRVQPTDLQKMLMQTIARNRKMRIEGVAGSGKSMLVKWEAERLQKEGKRVAVLCYNDLLAEGLERDLNTGAPKNSSVEVHSFHQFAKKYTRLARIPGVPKKEPRDPNAKSEYFDSLPKHFDRALDILRKEARSKKTKDSSRFFDAVLIDEGQDFENAWAGIALKLLKDRETGIVRFFYDPAQTLYCRNVLGNAEINAMPVMVLPCGFRSTRKILEWIRAETDIRIPCYDNTPAGKEVEVRFYTDPAEEAELLKKELERLKKKGVEKKDIQVVSMHSRARSGLKDFESDTVKWCEIGEPLDERKINIVSARRFKGLDSRVVILSDMTASTNDPGFPYSNPHLLLVAATRAREHLIVFKERKNFRLSPKVEIP